MKIKHHLIKDIITAIRYADYKKLIGILSKVKGFSEEKGLLKRYRNRRIFLVRHKLKFEDKEYLNFSNSIDSAVMKILKSL